MNDTEMIEAIREHVAPLLGWREMGSDGIVDVYAMHEDIEDEPEPMSGYTVNARDPVLLACALGYELQKHITGSRLEFNGHHSREGERFTCTMWSVDIGTVTAHADDSVRAILYCAIKWATGRNPFERNPASA